MINEKIICKFHLRNDSIRSFMNLTIKDRLILSNQYKILEGLYSDEKEYFIKAQTILSNGFELEYDSIVRHLDNEVVTIEECKEVLDILEMFSALKSGFEQLSDKSVIEEPKIRFLGFDGNNEVKQWAYAKYLRGDGRFTNLDLGDNYNSHFPMLAGYRRMLNVWKRSDNRFNLSKEEIVNITNARNIASIIKQNGAFAKDDTLDELREMIYKARGRAEVEETIS